MATNGSSVLGDYLSLGVCTCYFLSFLVFIACFFKLVDQNKGDDVLSSLNTEN